MDPIRSHLSVFAAAFLALVGWATAAHALVLDWDAVTWDPGSLDQFLRYCNDAHNDITISITSRQANIWADDPTYGHPDTGR